MIITFWYALAYVFAVAFIRALPWGLVDASLRQRKPLSCNACMVGWMVIASAFGQYVLLDAEVQTILITCIPSAGLAWLLLEWIGAYAGDGNAPPPPPPPL